MVKLIECVPNYSEGRRTDVIEAIVRPFKDVKGCYLLDYRADPDHNRLVVSLVGEPEALEKALIKSAKIAIENINLNNHQGAHPRIGVIDVIPFVPLRNISMEECVEFSRKFADLFHKETGVPVYFYEESALRADRRNLEVIRRGQYEALKKEITKPERHPDIGAPELHPTAGATVIGARKFLIAFNVNLHTKNVSVAKAIARAVRASSGGFSAVKAIGLELREKGMTQVSMNIVDFEKNAMYRVLELIKAEAKRWGVLVAETEVYGIVPAAALLDSASYYMQIAGFDPDQVIELRLLDLLGRD
ncbi:MULTISPECIES: glutamate formimidoyltransferase [Acetomicrobium]|jgi:glutamate formiminotransferase|uniref:glutamate formimidoyltransferase n=1 Tax=Acetomicrobium TaxID=49894 RepID=UPI001B574EE9|nr:MULTISPECIES: glutamate formimidoyltransferase [Acetomicrobium]MBP8675304.1 glutamate formimidoyltransferase [Acetomicrobium sp.]MDR9770873.1 glutamate formimidoyltransferase [Acetomicrobium sp.]HOB10978.1 glutamate formimidoyltransferase [Acetomicrobium sp.]HQA36808.1 glutamate formimidoyltransferase [Acetomicrobium sp.]